MKNIGIFIAVLIGLTSCVPSFSELDNAKNLGKNNMEVTPSIELPYAGLSGTPPNLSGRIKYGVTNGLDLEYTYTAIGIGLIGDSEIRSTYLSSNRLGAKYSLIQDRLAIKMEIGKYWKVERFLYEPSLLYTKTLQSGNLRTASIKYMYEDNDLDEGWESNYIGTIAFNFNYDWNVNDNWTVTPEIGFITSARFEGIYPQIAAGVKRKFSLKN